MEAFDAIQTLAQRPDSSPRTRPPSATGSQTRATPKGDYFTMQAMQLDKLISWVQGSHGAKDLGERLLASSAACEPIAPHQTLILRSGCNPTGESSQSQTLLFPASPDPYSDPRGIRGSKDKGMPWVDADMDAPRSKVLEEKRFISVVVFLATSQDHQGSCLIHTHPPLLNFTHHEAVYGASRYH